MSVVLPVRVKKEVYEKIEKLVKEGFGKNRNEVLNKLILLGLEVVEKREREEMVKRGKLSLDRKEDWVSILLGERE